MYFYVIIYIYTDICNEINQVHVLDVQLIISNKNNPTKSIPDFNIKQHCCFVNNHIGLSINQSLLHMK